VIRTSRWSKVGLVERDGLWWGVRGVGWGGMEWDGTEWGEVEWSEVE